MYKNFRKFNAQIIFLLRFQLHVKNKFPWQHGLFTFSVLNPMNQCDRSSITLIKSVQNVLRPPSHTQMSLPLSDWVIAALALVQLAPDCMVHRVEIRAVWRLLQGWYEIRSFTTQHLDSLHTGTYADVRGNFIERTLMETVNFWKPFIKCQYFNDSSIDFH